MAKFTTLPKVDLPAGGTPSEVNQYYALDATQANTEILNLIENTALIPTDSDTSQVSKSVSRYTMANLFIEGAGSSHSGSSDLYIAKRPAAAVTTSMKIPTTFIEGTFFFKASATNQSNNVQFQLNSNPTVAFKKFNMNGELINLNVGEIATNDIIAVHLDLANNVAILKRTLSADEAEGLVGKFNVKETLDFTTSAPTSSTIGYKYINITTGTISSGYIGAGTDTAVTANKIYQLYDDGTPYRWYEIDAVKGMIAFDETDNVLKTYNGTIWEGKISSTIKGINYLPKQIIISNNVTDVAHDIDFSVGNFNFDDGTGSAPLSAIIKQIDASWSAGTNQGGLDTGTVTNDVYYYLYAIYNPTTNISDALFSLSPTSPTMPSGYTKKKLIGAIRTDVSANIELFTQQGNLFNFKNPLLIFSSSSVIASPTTTTGILPVLPVSAKVSMNLNANTTGNVGLVVYGNLTTITEITDCASVASNDGYPFIGHGEIYANDGNISYYNIATTAGVDAQSSRLLSLRINNL